jgi:hypothetical protein
MRNFEESMWFKNPDLKVINVVGEGGSRVSKFSMSVQQGSGTEADIRRAPHQTLKASGAEGGTAAKPETSKPEATGKKS